MADRPRLIEVAFPLKETSIDSVHEKNVRHGHISTLHIWPARRPLAACRAVLIATLLPDPGDAEARRKLLEKIGGKIVEKVERKKSGGKVVETRREETEGGVLHWGRESSPDMDWFREEIRKAYNGRAPRVLDPFSGGGAIPLEAMRLGCDITAVDINPVAWFILKCTLEHPQKLADKKLPLPKFAMELPAFRKAWDDAQTKEGKKKGGKQKPGTRDMWESATPEAGFAWHVRAWGYWMLERARADLEQHYPVIDDKPTMAYLWARTVRCKGCRATIPLLKTRWLCKKDGKRIMLMMKPRPDGSGVDFSVERLSQKGSIDRKAGVGTMSRSGAQCPCCSVIMTFDDLRLEGRSRVFGLELIAAIVNDAKGREYRTPTAEERTAAGTISSERIVEAFADIPFGIPNEPTPGPAGSKQNSSSLRIYGLLRWSDIFLPRQLLALAQLINHHAPIRKLLGAAGYDERWTEGVLASLALAFDRQVDYLSALCFWHVQGEKLAHTFTRFAFPMTWDICEVNPLSGSSGGYSGNIDWVAAALEHLCDATRGVPDATVICQSAAAGIPGVYDVIVTDPPYYDAIAYSDITDFFYVWLRRFVAACGKPNMPQFASELTPKWDIERDDGELTDNPTWFGGDKERSKRAYERGMAKAFSVCRSALQPDGRMVVVFANKNPDAWEALVDSIIRAQFVVDASWPIMTELSGGVRNVNRASLSSSIWLVCKKRPDTARPGWDSRVLEDMRQRIHARLREFWDAGIRGPDVVWAATGPALEAYSKHPIVKKANEAGQVMAVSEFLRHVRRIVVDFVVGRVLTGDSTNVAVSGIDDVTTYYLLHRHDFGLGEAPIGASILYALSCGLSDRDLSDRHDLLARTGGKATVVEEEEPGDGDAEADEEEGGGSGSGNKVKLRGWDQRRDRNLGADIEGRPAPLVDKVHRLLHLWRTGEVTKVNEYLDAHAIWKSPIFHQLLQALVELAPAASEERALLESISNHVGAKGKTALGSNLTLPHTEG